MAVINNANLTAELIQLLNESGGTVDTAQITALINQNLPPDQQLARGTGVTTGVYKRFGEFDKVNAKVEVVTTGLWSGDAGSLTTFFTSSAQTAQSKNYYYNVYDKNPQSDTTAEVQFAVAYGHVNGSGSVSLAIDDDSTLASKAVYSQYRSLLLEVGQSQFQFVNSAGTTSPSPDIYVINLGRARFREKMDPQNWSLTLSGSSGSEIKFIDDSGKKFDDKAGKTGRIFNVAEGDLNLGSANEATITSVTASSGEGYGLFYPDRGLILLNPSAMHTRVGSLEPNLSTGSEQTNHEKLFTAISGGGDFEARRTENISTQHFFVRATNREFNFSNNPSFSDAADGEFLVPGFDDDPKTYITTVGLLNDANEIIAIAKSSQPIPKSFDREVLMKIKLDF